MTATNENSKTLADFHGHPLFYHQIMNLSKVERAEGKGVVFKGFQESWAISDGTEEHGVICKERMSKKTGGRLLNGQN